MSIIDELKQKWFIDVHGTLERFPPRRRHPQSKQVAPYTDGNIVIPLIDGDRYMGMVQRSINALPSHSDLWFTGWELDNVATLGATDTSSQNRAWDLIEDAHNRQITVCGLVSQHLGLSHDTNTLSITHFRLGSIGYILFDLRFPVPSGSHHQKLLCLRNARSVEHSRVFLGSLDLTRARWDRSLHLPIDHDREFLGGSKVSAPTHELGISVQGPAIADIEATFLERWNDASIISVDLASGTTLRVPFRIEKAPTVQAPQGPHSVQVLRTYGRVTQPILRYTWSNSGEFTIWSSFLNAIQKATSYIYIEDQYLIPFGFPLYCAADRPSNTRDTDLFYQLGEALKRGVKVLAVVPHRSEDPGVGDHQNYQRAIGLQFLNDIIGRGATGDLVVVSLFNGKTAIFVHSKLMIVDDEFALIGTANFNQRSMTHDSEVALGIVDAQNAFARDLRMRLWSEHLEKPLSDDPDVGFRLFKDAATTPTGSGRVRPFDSRVPPIPSLHALQMRSYIDPYGGPRR